MEKRRFTRVDFQTSATVRSPDGRELRGQVENLSLKGLFVVSPEPVVEGLDVEVLLELSGNESRFILDLKGRVVRRETRGFAVDLVLKGIDIDTLTHLRYIIDYNLGGDVAVDELARYLEDV